MMGRFRSVTRCHGYISSIVLPFQLQIAYIYNIYIYIYLCEIQDIDLSLYKWVKGGELGPIVFLLLFFPLLLCS
jgi:hypothetical protein